MNHRTLLCMTLCAAGLAAAPTTPLPQQSASPEAVASATPARTTVPPAAAQSGPASSVAPLAAARELYWSGKLEAALEAYRGMAAGPEAVSAHAGMARVYLKQKKVAEAAAAAAKAVELGPSSADAHASLGEVLFRQGKIREALAEFQAFAKTGTKEARIYLGLYRVNHAASYYKAAKTRIDQAYALEPRDPEIRHAWTSTVGVEERIKDLEAYLAAHSEETDEKRAAAQHLAFLRDVMAQPGRSCRLTSHVTSTQLKLEGLGDPFHFRAYGLRVKLNSGTAKLLLDTGGSGILLDRKLAEKAGLRRVADTRVRGIGNEGPAKGYAAFADTIQIGDLQFQDCYVDVVDRKATTDEDGLIGADVFSQFLLEMSLPEAKFKLSALPPIPNEPPLPPSLEALSPLAERLHDRYVAPEMKDFTPVFRFGHELLMDTRVNDSPPKLFLIDTGGFDNIISISAAKEFTKLRRNFDTEVRGVNGKVDKVYSADKANLQFASLQQDRNDLIALDLTNLSDSTGTEVSGILGFRMLEMLTLKIDYRDGLVGMSVTSRFVK